MKRATHYTGNPESQRGRALVGLREMVLRAEFAPGERIADIEVSRRLNVSKPLVRMAMERLMQEGLLEPTDSNGFSVREFTVRDIRDAIEARGAVEGTAARLAAERLEDVSELESAKRIHREIEVVVTDAKSQPLSAEEMHGYAELNSAFHAAIVNLAKSPMLRWSIERLQSIPFASPAAVVPPRSGEGAAEALAQHHQILAAIEARNGLRAEALMREHAAFARQNVEDALADAKDSSKDVGLALVRPKDVAAPQPVRPEPAPVDPKAEPTRASEADSDRGSDRIAERILDAAAALFCEKGYGRTTTREIAASLGIQQASLYHHMASKEDLLYRICMEAMAQFLRDVPAAIVPVTDPEQRLRALIGAHLEVLLSHTQRSLSMLTELRSLEKGHRSEVVAMRSSYSAMLRKEIEGAQANGLLRADIPAKYLRLGLLNMVNWAPRWFRAQGALSTAQVAELTASVFLEGVAAQRSPASSELPEWDSVSDKKPNRTRKLTRSTERATLPRLVRAAADLFSQKGYSAASTREVATLLGIEKASLYYHVESKEDLLYAIGKSSMEAIRADVEAALDGVKEPLARMRAMIRAHTESILRDQTQHSTTMAEMNALSPQRLAEVEAMQASYGELFRNGIRSGQEAGLVRGGDVRVLGFLLQGLQNRTLVWHHRTGSLAAEQLGQVWAELFLNGAIAPAKTNLVN